MGQGALGIETREDNILAVRMLKKINDEKTFIAVRAERALLKALEGGCQVPIGAYGEVKLNGLIIDAIVGSVDGLVTYRGKLRGSKKYPEKLGIKMAAQLLKAGASEILNDIYNKERSL